VPAYAEEPSSKELAAALTRHDTTPGGTGRTVEAVDLRAIHCAPIEDEPTEFVCRWQQRRGAQWRSYSTWLAVDGSGWGLIDDPHPGSDPLVDLP